RSLDCAGAVAARARDPCALRSRARTERAGGALRIALTLRVHGLIGTGDRARSPPPISVAVLLRGSGPAGVCVVPTRIAGGAAGSPYRASVRVAPGRRVVRRKGAEIGRAS